jgi:hypothetical protein
MSSYFNSNYHPVGMMKSVMNSEPSGSSSNSNSNRYYRPDYPTPKWPIPGKKYDTDYDIPALTEKGKKDLEDDRKEYAEAQKAKFRKDKDPYPEQYHWSNMFTRRGGKRRTRKSIKARKSRKSRKSRRR